MHLYILQRPAEALSLLLLLTTPRFTIAELMLDELPTPTNNLHLRDISVATIQFAPLTQYTQPAATPTTLTGSQFTMIPDTRNGSYGIDVYFGPDLFAALKAAVNANCVAPDNSKCQSSIESILTVDEVNNQRRQVAAYVALVTSLWKEIDPDKHIHLIPIDVSQFEATSSYSSFVFATATGDAGGPVFTTTPEVILGPSLITDDSGDVSINLDPDLATRLDGLIAHYQCISRRAGAVDLGCVSSTSIFVLQNVVNGPAADLVLIHDPLPVPLAADVVRALTQFVALGRTILQGLPITSDQVAGICAVVFWLVYEHAISQSTGVKNQISKDDINKKCPTTNLQCTDDNCEGDSGLCTKGDLANCPCDCPPEDRIPNCGHCGGDDGNLNCVGTPKLKGCPCIADYIRPYTERDAAAYQINLAALLALPPISQEIPVIPICQGDNLKVDRNFLASLLNSFCTNYDLSTELQRNLTYTNSSSPNLWENYYGWTFGLHFNPTPGGCSDTCVDAFWPMLSNNNCSPDPNTLSPHVLYEDECGDASIDTFPMIGALPAPPFSPGTCKVECLESKQLTFDLTKSGAFKFTTIFSVTASIVDGGGNTIGSAPATVAGDPNSLSLNSKLEFPLVIIPEETGDYVQFTINTESWHSTDPNCIVAAWVQVNVIGRQTTSERKIECPFECVWSGGKSSDGSN